MTMSCNRHEPLFDIHPMTGASIEVFFADGLATFGRGGAGWFWWCRMARLPGRSLRATQHIGTRLARRWPTAPHSLTHNVNADTVRTREIIEGGDLS